ncbi:MAG: sulfotransferase [Saprospiraceae bacterium]|nr:sulfotransferase [Saprospiraceae bacterium]
MIIGIQKGGTSWLSARLHEIPDVQLSYPKETHFFKFRWKPEYDTWSPARVRARYLRRFWKHPRAPVLFEASPGYIVDGAIARRIHRVMPDSKFVVILRDPVERAFSAYNMWVRKREWPLSFRETYQPAMERAIACASQHGDSMEFYHALNRDVPDNIISYGLYYYHLAQWFEVFPRKQFHVMTTRQLNDRRSLAALLSFVGVASSHLDHMQLAKVASGKYRGQPMNDTDRVQLSSFFAPYNEMLFGLLDRDLRPW